MPVNPEVKDVNALLAAQPPPPARTIKTIGTLLMAAILVLSGSVAAQASPATPTPNAAMASAAAVLHVSEAEATSLMAGLQIVSKPTNTKGVVSPNASVGLGWSIYWRLSPTDQKFIIQAGAAAVTAVICLVSAGTACVLAGAIAGIFAIWVATYYNPRCWVEIKTSYNGQLQGVNRYWKC